MDNKASIEVLEGIFYAHSKMVPTLKKEQRTGWLNKLSIDKTLMQKIPVIETVASHSWGLNMLIYLLQPILPVNVNLLKLYQMTTYHDIGECIIGDITPYCGISPAEKYQMEYNAILELSVKHNMPKLVTWFEELEESETIEAQLVHDLDKIDMLFQALYYEKAGLITKENNEFFNNFNKSLLYTSIGKQFVDFLFYKREQLNIEH